MNKTGTILLTILVLFGASKCAVQPPNQYTQMFLDAFLDRGLQSTNQEQNKLLIKNCMRFCCDSELLSNAIDMALILLPQISLATKQNTIECLTAILSQIPRFYIKIDNDVRWINENEIYSRSRQGFVLQSTRTAQTLEYLRNSIIQEIR